MKIKTLLIDDSIAFLTVAARFLATQPVDLIGRAQSGHAAIQMYEMHHPELVLLDLELNDGDGMNGMAVLRTMRSQPHPPCVVIVSLHDQDEYREAARLAGAEGFIAKREFATALAPLLHSLFNGDIAINLNNGAST